MRQGNGLNTGSTPLPNTLGRGGGGDDFRPICPLYLLWPARKRILCDTKPMFPYLLRQQVGVNITTLRGGSITVVY